ncbi:MAG: hypothetical protein HKP30_17625, partial [Myxococcales bacterium]|nr:hypothetical protein [Myxococcales bacterium]
MTELSFAETPPRAELIDRIQAELGSLGVSLRVVARDLLGADARIDLVASDPDGRLTLLLIGGEPDDLALVALGWPRAPGWRRGCPTGSSWRPSSGCAPTVRCGWCWWRLASAPRPRP